MNTVRALFPGVVIKPDDKGIRYGTRECANPYRPVERDRLTSADFPITRALARVGYRANYAPIVIVERRAHESEAHGVSIRTLNGLCPGGLAGERRRDRPRPRLGERERTRAGGARTRDRSRAVRRRDRRSAVYGDDEIEGGAAARGSRVCSAYCHSYTAFSHLIVGIVTVLVGFSTA